MLSLASSKQGLVKYTCYDENISKFLDFVLLNKTTKLMNHLGGKGLEWWFWLSGYTRPMAMVYLVYLTCGKPPRNKVILEAKC